MIKVYFDYSDPRVIVHRDPDCHEIQKQQITNQRLYQIAVSNLSTELNRIINNHVAYQFQAVSPKTTMWLEIDFQDYDFELALASYIQRILGQHYVPFRNVHLGIHC